MIARNKRSRFGNNLKADYEPEGRDREIEQIVRTIEKENLGMK